MTCEYCPIIWRSEGASPHPLSGAGRPLPSPSPAALSFPLSRPGVGDQISGKLEIIPLPGDHHTILREPYVYDLARAFRRPWMRPSAGTGKRCEALR